MAATQSKKLSSLPVELEYRPSIVHIEHYIYYAHSTRRERIQPYWEQGIAVPGGMGGSGFLYYIAQADLDWLFSFAAARLAALRLYEYFLAEKIKNLRAIEEQPRRKELQQLKNKILLENELTTLLILRYACQKYGRSVPNFDPRSVLGSFPTEEGFLYAGISIPLIDRDILLIKTDGVRRIIENAAVSDRYLEGSSLSKPPTSFAPKNLFKAWLDTQNKYDDIDALPHILPAQAENLVTSVACHLANFYENESCEGKALLQHWLALVKHPDISLFQERKEEIKTVLAPAAPASFFSKKPPVEVKETPEKSKASILFNTMRKIVLDEAERLFAKKELKLANEISIHFQDCIEPFLINRGREISDPQAAISTVLCLLADKHSELSLSLLNPLTKEGGSSLYNRLEMWAKKSVVSFKSFVTWKENQDRMFRLR